MIQQNVSETLRGGLIAGGAILLAQGALLGIAVYAIKKIAADAAATLPGGPLANPHRSRTRSSFRAAPPRTVQVQNEVNKIAPACPSGQHICSGSVEWGVWRCCSNERRQFPRYVI